jgi:Bacterial protein of unknown function (DUF922)
MQAQKIVVRGQPHSGMLSWTDFTGLVPPQSAWDAKTAVSVSPEVRHERQPDGRYKVVWLEVTVKLDSVNTWVRPGKQSDRLLQHEQGHFDLYILCAREMDARIRDAAFAKGDVQSLLRDIVRQTMDKYNAISTRYDAETEHYRNAKMQSEWVARIRQHLTEGTFPE